MHLFNVDCKEKGILLTRFDGTKGIVKCKHIEKENTINLLRSISKINSHKIKIKTLGTSGTIKALVRKHMDKDILY
jgi:RNase P/RNase MRP subunit POP5